MILHNSIKPGIKAEDVDAAARSVIEEAGYGEYVIHRTGHGLGLEIHEPPYIVGGNELILDLGMTFTVEPGIYLPGRGGVRIEDDVLVTEDGCETLTTLSRQLLRLQAPSETSEACLSPSTRWADTPPRAPR